MSNSVNGCIDMRTLVGGFARGFKPDGWFFIGYQVKRAGITHKTSTTIRHRHARRSPDQVRKLTGGYN